MSVCLSISICICLSACLPKSVGPYACVSDCLICLSICVRLSVYLFMCVCTSVSVNLSVILTVFRNGGRERNSGRQTSWESRWTEKYQIEKPKRNTKKWHCLTLLFELLRANYKPFVLRTFARRVFPQPGGPASRIPGGWVRPSAWNSPGYFTGAWQDGKSIKLNIVTQKTKPKTLGFSVSWLKILLLIPQGQLLQLPKRDYILNDDFTSAEVILTG